MKGGEDTETRFSGVRDGSVYVSRILTGVLVDNVRIMTSIFFTDNLTLKDEFWEITEG